MFIIIITTIIIIVYLPRYHGSWFSFKGSFTHVSLGPSLVTSDPPTS